MSKLLLAATALLGLAASPAGAAVVVDLGVNPTSARNCGPPTNYRRIQPQRWRRAVRRPIDLPSLVTDAMVLQPLVIDLAFPSRIP
jgi:hypothetical protein